MKNFLILSTENYQIMSAHQRYRVFDPTIASEIFENEVVIVNLLSGVYYSLTGSAAEVWERLITGYSVEEVVNDLQYIYGPGLLTESLHRDVDAFVNALLEHSLIAPNDEARTGNVEGVQGSQGTYVPPAIEVFQDMQDILLLDPVHDVNDLGWPTKVAAPENQSEQTGGSQLPG